MAQDSRATLRNTADAAVLIEAAKRHLAERMALIEACFEVVRSGGSDAALTAVCEVVLNHMSVDHPAMLGVAKPSGLTLTKEPTP